MGRFANGRLTNLVAIAAALLVLALNAVLLLLMAGVPLPLS